MTNVLGTDVSFYEDDPSTIRHIDFVKMGESCGFTFVRAGQNTWVDPSFATNWRLAKEAGMPRGAYWFYDSRSSPISQAQLWASTMKGDLGELPLCCDYEENYNGPYKGAANFQTFMQQVRSSMPNHEIIIYTGYYYWKDNVPISYHSYFSQYALWIAHYGVASPSIPAPWKTWLFWQFSETGDGPTFGTEGSVDLDWFNGDLETFKKRFGLEGGDPPINNDQHIQTHSGVTCHIVSRFGTKCVVQVINPRVVEVYVTGTGFASVGDAVAHFRADGGVNGGGWPNVQSELYRSNEIWVSEGNYLQSRAVDNRPFMNVSQYGQAEIRETDADISGLWNTWGFDRILGSNGMFNPKIADRTTKDARTGAGITADGKVVLLSAEGNDRFNVGLTFPEMWSVLFEFGAMIAGNNDGGSSSACWNTAIDTTKSLIVPSDGSDEARVINHVLFFASGGQVPPDGGETMATTKKGVARLATNIKPMAGGGAIATLPPGGWVYGNMSNPPTDMIDIVAWYRPTGERMALVSPCKATASNLTITNDPGEGGTPPPNPTPVKFSYSMTIHDDETNKTYTASGDFTEVI